VTKAIQQGVITSIPSQIVLAAHFSRADLSTVRDFPALKRQLDAVRKTYATTTKPFSSRVPTNQGEAPTTIRVIDTMLLSPNGSSLSALGDALGLPKVELPEGYSKERMDLFLADHTKEFIAYAMTDAEIAAKWTARVLGIIRNELHVTGPCATLGAVALR